MPLEPEAEAIIPDLHSLNDAVGAGGCHLKPVRHLLQSLMVVAVGPDAGTEEAVEDGPFHDGDRMGHISPFRLLHVFGCLIGILGNILVKGASKSHVQHLDAPADGDEGLSALNDHTDQGQLIVVQQEAGGTAVGTLELTVVHGGYVLSAAEDKALAEGYILSEDLPVSRHGKEQGSTAAADDGCGIIVIRIDPGDRQVVIDCGDTDGRFL